MAVSLHVSDDGIDVLVTGWFDRLMCVTNAIHVDMADIVGARPVTWDEAVPGMGWRLGGAYWPGRIATGWYGVPDRKGARQWWAVFRDRDHLLEVETRLENPTRLVLANPDRDRLCWWINERVPTTGR